MQELLGVGENVGDVLHVGNSVCFHCVIFRATLENVDYLAIATTVVSNGMNDEECKLPFREILALTLGCSYLPKNTQNHQRLCIPAVSGLEVLNWSDGTFLKHCNQFCWWVASIWEQVGTNPLFYLISSADTLLLCSPVKFHALAALKTQELFVVNLEGNWPLH